MIDIATSLKEVSQLTDKFLAEKEQQHNFGPQAKVFLSLATQALKGGKQFRARCVLIGASATQQNQAPNPATLTAAVALEVFHAAALVHDDIIDNSDTRRGKAASHIKFADHHSHSRWHGNPRKYGKSAGILLGDLLLSYSDELIQSALKDTPSAESATATQNQFNQMRFEVTVGQYLDIAEESSWTVAANHESVARALQIASLKSARYSIQQPLQIGAATAGANPEQIAELGRIGHELGMAFQLRDDVLGVFGQTETTGKPSGDDLREGKRTVLIAYLRENSTPEEVAAIDSALGDPELSADKIKELQEQIIDRDALAKTEELISSYSHRARNLIAESKLNQESKAALDELTDAVSQRKV